MSAPRGDPPPGERKPRDRALVLPVIGAVLLLPPLANVFVLDGAIGGVPATLAYVFVVWAALIAGAAAQARRLRREIDATPGPEMPGTG